MNKQNGGLELLDIVTIMSFMFQIFSQDNISSNHDQTADLLKEILETEKEILKKLT